ncbi:MAG: hypothetical protein AAFO83_12220, partial [Cyanobacteria bacterium J06607_13]
STAATFACGSATLDFTPGLCDHFAGGLQKIFRQAEQTGRRTRTTARNRPTRDTSTRSTSTRSTSTQTLQNRTNPN